MAERHDDEVTGLEGGDLGADLLDDPDTLVADGAASVDVVLTAVGPQVGAADAARSDLDDGVGGRGDRGSGDVGDLDLARGMDRRGTHGVILLQNVRRVSVKNVTVRQSKAFGVHLANAHDFIVENITLEEHRRDGVHVNGPASNGLIRGVRGDSKDDDVALNAWEWKNYAPSYGPIERIVIEDVTGWPGDDHDGNVAIRVLPGVKRFDDGTTLDCPIRDITLRRITDIRHFKIYDQPNLELGRDNDFSVGVGTVKNFRFEDLTFNRPGQIELHANTDGLSIHNVRVNHPITPDWHLLAIGPLSQTYKHGKSEDPMNWTEIFSPDLDCTVRNLSVSGVRVRGSQGDLPVEQIVHVIEQKPNLDYPKSTPRGGTGKGIWIR